MQQLRAFPVLFSATVLLGDLISAWLDARKTSQAEVARRGKIAPPKLSAIVTGKNPDPQWSTIQKVLHGLRLDAETFFAGPPAQTQENDDDVPAELPDRSQARLEDLLRPYIERTQADARQDGPWQADILAAIAHLTRALQRDQSVADSTRSPRKARQ